MVVGDLQRSGMKFGHELNHLVLIHKFIHTGQKSMGGLQKLPTFGCFFVEHLGTWMLWVTGRNNGNI